MEQDPTFIQTLNPITSSQEAVISSLLALAESRGYGFALWRLPNATVTSAILSSAVEAFTLTKPFEELPFGFVFHPFNHQQDGVFLKADRVFRFTNGKLAPGDDTEVGDSIHWWQEQLQPENTDARPPQNMARAHHPVTAKNKDAFIELVQQCRAAIEQGAFEKVVPSRVKSVTLPEHFDIARAIANLNATYPNALISFVYTPAHGSWLGATPEILVSVEDKKLFKTVALAGTQPYTPGVNLRYVAWTQKEIEEQALVSRYIINCFKKIRLREYEEHGPKTMVAGNLMHLKTDYIVDMVSTNFPQLGSVMLRLLHPTSAVCGMPLEASADFLVQEEGYDRSFYSGFLGPVNDQDNSHLFVNLRCMKIDGNEALCFAGAGVTVDSVPEKEWEETEIKMNTLLHVIY
jgi:isochorismate synthase